MTKPLVSVCCLTYNHENYIRECLDSFIMQKTNFAFEVLIHDDASTDKTADIIREYEVKYPNIIKPIYQTENQYSKGVKPTFEFNFPRAQGKYIAMCEGDDYWTDPLKLQKQIDFLEAHPDYVLSCHNYKILDFDGESYREGYEEYFVKDKKVLNIDEEMYLEHWLTKTLTVVVLNDSKIINEYSQIKNKRDLSLFYVFISNGKGVFHNFHGGVYRKQKGGVHSSNNALQAQQETLTILEELYSIYKTENLFKRIQLLKTAIIYLKYKHFSTSKKVPLRESLNLKISLYKKTILILSLYSNRIKKEFK